MSIKKYSIIIPHKDSLDLLARCVDSIPIRDDIQTIVVDDNSNISNQEWDRFLKSHSHLEFYPTTEGKGAGYARNIGLRHATGKWLLFADADDYFYDKAFQVLDDYSDSEFDVIYFVSDSRNGSTLQLIQDRMPIIRQHIENKNLNGLRFQSLVPWGKMIRRSVVEDNHIRFDEVEVSNDVMFSMRLGVAACSVNAINIPLYCNTSNSNSLHFHRTVQRMKLRLQVYKRANDFLYDNGKSEYRIPFSRGAFYHIKFFYPNHPLLIIWGILHCRYKNDPWGYFKEVCAAIKKHYSAKI